MTYRNGFLCSARDSQKNQSGNAVVFILLAVALFGALSYTFMRGSKSGQGNLTQQQAKLAAQELISYAQNIERAVNKIRQRGYSENQISFLVPGTVTEAIHTNPNCTDNGCLVFNPAGGGINFILHDSWFFNKAGDVTTTIYLSGYNCIEGFQPITTCIASERELVMYVTGVKREICQNINFIAGAADLQAEPPSFSTSAAFLGNFGPAAGNPVRIINGILSGKNFGCSRDTDGGSIGLYIMHYVLIER